MSDTNLLQSIVADPSVRDAINAQFEAKRADIQAQLAELDSAQASLFDGAEAAPAPTKRGRPKGSTNKPKDASDAGSASSKGRPRGKRTGPSQRQQVIAVLAKHKNGLRSGELAEKTGISSKVLQTLLSVMKSKHNEIKTTGKARNKGGGSQGFTYFLTAKAGK